MEHTTQESPLLFRYRLLSSVPLTPRLNRFERLPYIMDRWNASMSIAVFATEEEVKDVAFDMINYKSSQSIVYTIYVRKRISSSNTPYYLNREGVRFEYPDGVYPLNVLRNLAIESITTSHYMLIDADVFLSTTLLSSIQKNKNILHNHKNVMVIPLFEYQGTNYLQRCVREGMCEYA